MNKRELKAEIKKTKARLRELDKQAYDLLTTPTEFIIRDKKFFKIGE